MPKSPKIAFKSSEMNIFSGLISQCKIGGFKECKNNKAFETSKIKFNFVFSVI